LGIQRVVQYEGGLSQAGTLVLADRLSHQGGLNGSVTDEQTTNLPTAALTRYTDGVGVMAALEVYTDLGNTGSALATVSYTNELGVAGRVSQQLFLGNNYYMRRQFFILPLADGDLGVRSVESVTLSASTGVAGNFGVTLFKPLLIMPFNAHRQQHQFDSVLSLGGIMPRVLNDASLFLLFNATLAPLDSRVVATMRIIEE
jgi:hypothetical protein